MHLFTKLFKLQYLCDRLVAMIFAQLLKRKYIIKNQLHYELSL